MRPPMKLMLSLLLLWTLIFLFPGIGQAAYGNWSEMNEGSAANLTFGFSAASDSVLYASGFSVVDSMLSFTYAWRSDDGGATWEPSRTAGILQSPCAIAPDAFAWSFDASFTDENNGVLAGMDFERLCFTLAPFPYCFICLLTFQPSVWYTDDGGDSWASADLGLLPIGRILLSVQMVSREIGYTVGIFGYVAKTENGGKKWNQLSSPSSNVFEILNDVHFLDEQTGWVAGGEFALYKLPALAASLDRESFEAAALSEGFDPEAFTNDFQHTLQYLKDPIYRHRFNVARGGESTGEKDTAGSIYFTEDGGETWTTQFQSSNRIFYDIDCVDEENCWALAEVQNSTDNSWELYHWDGTQWDQQPLLEELPVKLDADYIPTAVFFSSPNVGWVVGVSGDGVITQDAVILFTRDGGLTWEMDPFSGAASYTPREGEALDPTKAWIIGNDLGCAKYSGDNDLPIADAGPDQTVDLDASVVLDGSASYDPEGFDITYLWTQTSGNNVDLQNPTESGPSFTAAQAGEFVFSLVVSDGVNDSLPDEVIIIVTGEDEDDDDSVDDDSNDDDEDHDDDSILPSEDDDDDDNDDSSCCG